MTREEAKHIVDVAFDVPQAVRRIGEDRTYHKDEIREAKNKAIEALEQLTSYEQTINKLTKAISEQATILDKIIADIQNLRNCSCGCSDGIIDDVEDIIDKYRGES